jgi:DNA mismatch repair ATPase MutS
VQVAGARHVRPFLPCDTARWLQVTFKFKLTAGACPKSYGPSVARAAGIPVSIAERAVAISDKFEAEQASRRLSTAGSMCVGTAAADCRGEGVKAQEVAQEDAAAGGVLSEFLSLWGRVGADRIGAGAVRQEVLDLTSSQRV